MPRKILLADDSVTAQNMGRKILTEAGYEVVTVNNGAAAIKKIAEIKPDLVVLDIHMPGYSGLEVCQRLRETPKLARIPVLLTVGKLEPFRADDARRVKADAYVIKPFEATELLAVLTRLEDKIVPASPDAEDDEGGWRSRLRIPAPYMKKEESPVEASTQVAPGEQASPRVEETAAQPRETESEKVVSIDQAPAAEPVPVEVASDEASPAPVSVASPPPGDFSECALPAETGSQPADQEPSSTTFSIEAEAPIASYTPAAPEPTEAAASAPAPEIPTADDVTAALASLVPATAAVDQASDEQPAGEVPELATAEMAVNPGADTYASPRWVADEVPVSEEESGLVLELEMQRAYAAFAAADAARWGNYSPAVSDAAQPEAATSQPEATEQARETTYDAEVATKVAAYIDNEEDLIYSEIAAAGASKTAESVQSTPDAASAVAAEEKAAYAVASAGATAVSPGPVEVQPATEVPCAPGEPASPEHEAELATAWDHWKHIRESVASPEFAAQIAESAPVVAQESPSEPALESAQAESSSDSGDEANEIASIVDSVLADLKPKLMEEIAKKMGKGKKK